MRCNEKFLEGRYKPSSKKQTRQISNKWPKRKRKLLRCVWLFVTPWTIQSVEFSRPEYWSGLPFPSPGDLLDPVIELGSPALQVDSLPTELSGKPWLRMAWCKHWHRGFPGGSDGKESACNEGDLGSILELGRSPGEGKDYPVQYSDLENPMDREAWRATVQGVTKSQTRLSE